MLEADIQQETINNLLFVFRQLCDDIREIIGLKDEVTQQIRLFIIRKNGDREMYQIKDCQEFLDHVNTYFTTLTEANVGYKMGDYLACVAHEKILQDQHKHLFDDQEYVMIKSEMEKESGGEVKTS